MPKPYSLKMKIKHLILRAAMTLMSVQPINKKKVLIVSYLGKGYGDNGKAIAESLLKKDPELDVVWAAKPEYLDSVPKGIRTVTYNSLRYLQELVTAGAWVDNCRKNPGIRKRKGQFYVQTWHGPISMKQIEMDVEDKLDELYVAGAKNDSKMMDVMLSGNDFFTKLAKRVFWYDGEVMVCGSPRLDVLVNMDAALKQKVRQTLGVAEDSNIILYAPTFRADGGLECYRMDFDAVLETLEKKTGKKWVFAVRLHPNVAEKAKFITYSDRILNATNYPDLYELLPVVDFVITDYSSIMFEAGMINKPTMLFATDVAEYVNDRNFYFDIHKMPFRLSENNEQLLEALENFDQKSYGEELARFNATIGFRETGKAADAVADRILEELNGKTK